MPLTPVEIGLLAAAIGASGTNTTVQAVQGKKGYRLGKWNLNWQKYQQKKSWERQDTAYQRTVADLKAAGLNPVLAAGGSPTSSGPISSVDTPKPPVPQIDLDLPMAAMSMMKMKQDISTTAAQEKLLGLQGKKAIQEGRAAGQKADEIKWNLDWYKKQGAKGLPTNSTTHMKEFAAASDFVKSLLEAQLGGKTPGARVKDVQKKKEGNINMNYLLKGFNWQNKRVKEKKK